MLDRQGEAFLARVFTAGEIAYCEAARFPEQRFGARWAAKEAVSKALGTGIGEALAWREIEVVRLASGEPTIVLHGGAAAFAKSHGIVEIKVSLTHTDHYAAANAFALGRED